MIFPIYCVNFECVRAVRRFVFAVDRILEIVSSDLESEKEATIFKLIQQLNESNKSLERHKLCNEQLKHENDILTNTQKKHEFDDKELEQMTASVKEKETLIAANADSIKSVKDELQIKIHECERQQT
jgi:hypothetical protein